MTTADKYEFQASQYEFPYHYIPHFNQHGNPSLVRRLNWGLEYLCYQLHIREKVLAMNPLSILEVGCGDGFFIGNLPSNIPVRVGIDLSPRAVDFAKAFHPNCEFYCQEVTSFKRKFDVVVAIEVLEHLPENALQTFLQALCECLNQNGRVVISVPTTVLPLNKKHYRHYTIALLIEQLRKSASGLKVVQVEHVFAKPWWYDIFCRLSDNKLLSLELKPFMRFAWLEVWTKYRQANESNGFHLVAILQKTENT